MIEAPLLYPCSIGEALSLLNDPYIERLFKCLGKVFPEARVQRLAIEKALLRKTDTQLALFGAQTLRTLRREP